MPDTYGQLIRAGLSRRVAKVISASAGAAFTNPPVVSYATTGVYDGNGGYVPQRMQGTARFPFIQGTPEDGWVSGPDLEIITTPATVNGIPVGDGTWVRVLTGGLYVVGVDVKGLLFRADGTTPILSTDPELSGYYTCDLLLETDTDYSFSTGTSLPPHQWLVGGPVNQTMYVPEGAVLSVGATPYFLHPSGDVIVESLSGSVNLLRVM